MSILKFKNLLRLATGIVFLQFAGAATSAAEEATARGVVRAIAEATIAVDYAARIKKLPFQEGDSFEQGETLIVFDCKRYNAEIAAARATANARQLVVTNNQKLLARGAIGSNELKLAQAELSKAVADVAAVQARTGSCDFKAPFSGRLVERMAHEFDSPSPNQPLIRIVDTSRMEVETIIPSKWMMWVKPGTTFDFAVDETGENISIKVLRLGAVVDPSSQTIKAYGTLMEHSNSVLPGMSGTATFRQVGS